MKTAMAKTWKETQGAWRMAYDRLIEQFRPLYFAEVQRLAEKLRPQFKAGRVGGILDAPDGEIDPEAIDRLEDVCADYFGVSEGRAWDDWDNPKADRMTAHLILAVSPSASYVCDGAMRGSTPSELATMAAANDVLACAIARRWHVPNEERDESTPGLATITLWTAREAA
jgi:hypothetical protein